MKQSPAVDPSRDEAISTLLTGRSPRVRRLSEALRRLVHALVPGAVEQVDASWGVLSYRRSGYVCYIEPKPDAVLLGFYCGAELHDPRRRLAAAGGVTHHVRVRTLADVRDPTLRDLLRQASDLDRLNVPAGCHAVALATDGATLPLRHSHAPAGLDRTR